MYLQALLLSCPALIACFSTQVVISEQDSSLMSSGKNIEYIFGGGKSWNTSTLAWKAVTDRVRGGSSQSFLDPTGESSAVFRGILDTKTLGGAGFASQSTKAISSDGIEVDEPTWDLSSYDGLVLAISAIDSKIYTVTLKDELPKSKRDDGREQSEVAWEADFKLEPKEGMESSSKVLPLVPHKGSLYLVEIPWAQFRATYRGRDKPDAKPLQTDSIRRFALMMRSFFEKQEGDFEMTIAYIAAFHDNNVPAAKLSL